MKIRSLAIALLATAACRSSSSSNTPDAPNGGGPDAPNGGGTTIYDIQDPSNKVQVGAMVNVQNVVVTAIDAYGAKTGAFWIEEKGGGAYSGVEVFGADASQVAALKVGDVVSVTGAQKAEFALPADTSGRTTTELEPPKGGAITVMKTADGTVPDAAPVDALAIGMMKDKTAQDAEWEKWEGVRIKVTNVGVISSTKPIGGSTPDPTFQSFDVTGPLTVESSLAAFPTSGTPAKGPQFGDCLGSITGIGDYFFQWNLLPTATADIATGGSGCPVAETGATACGDGIDNDANGHADCGDFSCDTSVPSCVKDTTIAAINMGTIKPGDAVKLTGKYVVAIGTNGTFWIADDLAAATYGGIEAYKVAPTTLPAGMMVGSQIDIDLTYVSPFNGLLEVAKVPGSTPTITVQKPLAGVPTAVATSISTLADATNGPPYVGSLVTITNAKVTMVTTTGTGSSMKTIYTLSDGTKTIEMGEDLFKSGATMNACYASITGVASLDTSPKPSLPLLLPRSAADLKLGGTCP
jgi:hypothetical protein